MTPNHLIFTAFTMHEIISQKIESSETVNPNNNISYDSETPTTTAVT